MPIARRSGKSMYGTRDLRREMIRVRQDPDYADREARKMAETKCSYAREGKCCAGHCKAHGMRVSGTVNYPPCSKCPDFKPKRRGGDERENDARLPG